MLVSILVLVDLAFEFADHTERLQGMSFNPCFRDLAFELQDVHNEIEGTSFNPCFSGSCFRIKRTNRRTIPCQWVSILVLVDLAFE